MLGKIEGKGEGAAEDEDEMRNLTLVYKMEIKVQT